jgi:uncharacterized protein with PIN domain
MVEGAGDPVLRFAVERTLGRLARWLRLLGHDAVYANNLHGRALLARGRREGRVVLTRDHRVAAAAAPPRCVLLASDQFREQLAALQAAVPIALGPRFQRCVECNRPTTEASLATVRERVPPYVAQTQTAFRHCPGCGRVYWRATHHQHAERELRALGFSPAEERA